MSQDDLNRQAFLEEASDLLSELESALLELEESPDDGELIDRVFRAMHTIKGSGAMFGFDDIAAFTHEVETVFDRVRNGEMRVERELLDLTLASRDHIAGLLAASGSGKPVDQAQGEAIIKGLQDLAGQAAPAAPRPEEPEADEDAEESLVTYRVRFKPLAQFFLSGSNPLGLLEELCELGESHVFVHTEDVPPLGELEPENAYMWWDVILSTGKGEEAIRDVFLFVEDDCDLDLRVLDSDATAGVLDVDEDYKKLGEILVERGDIDPKALKEVLGAKKRLGDMLTEAGIVSPEQVESALAEQKAVRDLRKTRAAKQAQAGGEPASSIRVAADKLDYLVDLVGELVIVQAQISQQVAKEEAGHDQAMSALAEQLERLSDELRDATLGIRMLPIGTTFSKFRRLVRDLSAELGKVIELSTKGAETELDKTVIERLNDPLVHLLRNSIDHGIETPAQRKGKGKPEAGSIRLEAEHSGGEVLISITDDGKGLDPEVIRAKAIERGIISAEADLSDKEILKCIFQPGFSTAERVTSVSGRGVGMDVVKRSIDSLRGSIDIDSTLGVGATITVKLPLTLAIIDGLQVKVGEEHFVIPLSLVEECVELVHNGSGGPGRPGGSGASLAGGVDTETSHRAGRREKIVNLRGEIVPYIRLGDWFEVPGERLPIEQIVVVGVAQGRYGIVVDHVIGEHQTVIKSLGRVYRDVEGVSGATIRGDGSMALILDVPRVVEKAIEAQA